MRAWAHAFTSLGLSFVLCKASWGWGQGYMRYYKPCQVLRKAWHVVVMTEKHLCSSPWEYGLPTACRSRGASLLTIYFPTGPGCSPNVLSAPTQGLGRGASPLRVIFPVLLCFISVSSFFKALQYHFTPGSGGARHLCPHTGSLLLQVLKASSALSKRLSQGSALTSLSPQSLHRGCVNELLLCASDSVRDFTLCPAGWRGVEMLDTIKGVELSWDCPEVGC